MKIVKLVTIILTLKLVSCASNADFSKEINGPLKPINSEEIKNNV